MTDPAKEERAFKIWFVDDSRENRDMWKDSFGPEIQAACELSGFDSIDELEGALEGGDIPDILFIDFFVPPRYGSDVLEWFRNFDGRRPVLIAHSSSVAANVGMLERGADFMLRKVKGQAVTASIQAAFANLEDVRFVLMNRRPPKRDPFKIGGE